MAPPLTTKKLLAFAVVAAVLVLSAIFAPQPQAPHEAHAERATPSATPPSSRSSSAEQHSTSPETPDAELYHVARIGDGDTLELRNAEGQQFRVRLQGVDCPELAQPHGEASLEFTRQLCRGKKVRLTRLGEDQYHRVLGIVEVDGQNLNRELVRAGHAWWYRQYAQDPQLKTLEVEARAARRGLWADDQPLAPWEYRREHNPRERR